MSRCSVIRIMFWVAAAGSIAARSPAQEPLAAARRLAGATPGSGHAELAALADRLAALDPGELAGVLAAFADATPAGANWLRSGLDRAVERLGDAVPADHLAAFATDRGLPPRSRVLAYGWLEARDAARAASLVDSMLDEPALDLRRLAVTKLLTDAATADQQARIDVHRRALEAARDVDQVEAIATWLGANGVPTEIADVLGFVRRWRVSAAFDNAGGAGFAKAYDPETADVPSDIAAWRPVASTDKHGEVDLNSAVAARKGVLAYAAAEVEVGAAGRAEVRVGSPCAIVVWINGRRVMEHEIYHASEAIDQYVAPADFRAGSNMVLVKCCQNEQTESWAGDWKFQLRITDPLGKPVATQTAESVP